MKLDHDLVRMIMLEIEEVPAADFPVQTLKTVEGCDVFTLAAHVYLLQQDGYVEGQVVEDEQGRPIIFVISCLTRKGHDFVASAASPTVWNQGVGYIKKAGLKLTLDLLNNALQAAAKAELIRLGLS
jgi:hypothetical protein